MNKSVNEKNPTVVARVYDIMNCGPNNRFVANGKLVHNSGSNNLNMQNLPRGSILRQAITAPPKHLLVVCDLGQIEARMTAWLAQEDKILDVFRAKRDLYCEVAAQIFNRPITKADKHERFCGKSAALGLNYGMGPEKFQAWCKQSGASLELDFCRDVVKTYREKFANIPALWKYFNQNIHCLRNASPHAMGSPAQLWKHPTKDITFRPNHIDLPSGRSLNYGLIIKEATGYRIKDSRYIHGALLLENCVQGISRDILAEQILAAEEFYPVVMHTHDEIVWCVPENEAEFAKNQLLAIMRTPPAWCSDVPLDAEASTGYRYGDCK